MGKTAGILVYIEHHNNTVASVSLELIGKAMELAEQKGEPVWAVAVGERLDFLEAELQGYGIAKTILFDQIPCFRGDYYESPLCQCIRQLQPAVVLIGGTMEGRTLAPRLAVTFRTGVTADCTELSWDEQGNLIQTRPAFGGNIMASILTENSRPQIATIRAKIFEIPAKDKDENTEFEYIHWKQEGIEYVTSHYEYFQKKIDITKQDVLVVAGRGVQKKEDLQMLERLAEKLGGALASSRALVEKGWTTPAQQIGLSGNSVAPKCILTFGVSGSVQFMAGMKTTPNIIAVNTDPEAKIFEIAHYPICADLYEIVPKLLEIYEVDS